MVHEHLSALDWTGLRQQDTGQLHVHAMHHAAVLEQLTALVTACGSLCSTVMLLVGT